MTCIVGIKTPTGVLIGGDTQGSSGWDKRQRIDEKVFLLSRSVGVGFTTSYRMGQILRFHLELADISAWEDEFAWAVKHFVPAARSAFKEHGYQRVEHSREEAGTFLLAVRGRLFKICDDMQVAESASTFDATGCGENYALGALSVLPETDAPKTRATSALVTAARWSSGVGGQFTLVETKK